MVPWKISHMRWQRCELPPVAPRSCRRRVGSPCAGAYPACPLPPRCRSFGPPNDTVYSALLTLIQRQGIQERTVDVWSAIQADGVRLSPHLFSSLFAGRGAGCCLLCCWLPHGFVAPSFAALCPPTAAMGLQRHRSHGRCMTSMPCHAMLPHAPAACAAESASMALVEVAMNAADAMHTAWQAQAQRPNRRASEDR